MERNAGGHHRLEQGRQCSRTQSNTAPFTRNLSEASRAVAWWNRHRADCFAQGGHGGFFAAARGVPHLSASFALPQSQSRWRGSGSTSVERPIRMDSQKRMLIALGLSFALTLAYMTFFASKGPPSQPATPPSEKTEQAPAPTPTQAPSAPAPVPSGQVPMRELERDFSVVHYRIASRGGGLAGAELQGQKMREQVHLSFREGLSQLFTGKEPFRPQVDMAIPVPGQPLPL